VTHSNAFSLLLSILSAARNIVDFMDNLGRFVGTGGHVDEAIATWEWTIAQCRGRLSVALRHAR
jgi:hypothetical protein